MPYERSAEDRWDHMVTIPCGSGSHRAQRLPLRQVEGRDELVGIVCEICGHRFDWEVPPEALA